jgi:hypothetical protein
MHYAKAYARISPAIPARESAKGGVAKPRSAHRRKSSRLGNAILNLVTNVRDAMYEASWSFLFGLP